MTMVANSLMMAVLVAMAIDIFWGEPTPRFHPVVWMGRYLGIAGSWAAPTSDCASNTNATSSFFKGILGWSLGASVVCTIYALAESSCAQLPVWASFLAIGFLLKPLLSWRMLLNEVGNVNAALEDSLESGRERLSWLCSRNVNELSATEVRETAIETLAENLSDSVVAPLFWFAIAGLPGAALYRFTNTADAMWGYTGNRNGRYWQWAGKWAAHIDDLLSWVPARLTAILLVLGSGRVTLPSLFNEARRTPSPNGGWPMGAMAILLNVKLGKKGVYALHEAGNPACCADTSKACNLAARAVWLTFPASYLLLWMKYA